MIRPKHSASTPHTSRELARQSCIPSTLNYPEALPVSAKAGELCELIRSHQVVIVAGDTGSGKTTQLPKICLQAGRGRAGIIGHTQPRRLAARAVATRIAHEVGPEAARGVGSQVRFDDRTRPETFLKLMTDGILLAEIQSDPLLRAYDTLIIDEAHERSLNIDFLLGFLRQLIDRRDDLKILITSATIDVDKFSAHFNNAPIVTIEGRTFPVDVRYKPIEVDDEGGRQEDPQAAAIAESVREILTFDKSQGQSSGDILVFLPSEREIRDTATYLRKAKLASLDIMPLYGRLQHAEQEKIFASHSKRRVVLATNVAETSITVPGVNYVIDTGTARISRYSLQNKVQRLPIESISQASANQRKGRCGRVAKGLCIRLYSEQDFESRPEFTDPEILRTNLAAVILRMLSLNLGSIEDFPFLETPPRKAVNEGHKLLLELNAITTERKLTAIGKKMARLPSDPRYSRMLIEADRLGVLGSVITIVSGLSIQDPRESYADNRQLAAERHAQYKHPDSDFMSFLLLWRSFEDQRQTLSQSSLRKYCKKQLLSFMRMREWREVHRQLRLACEGLGLRGLQQDDEDYAKIHKSLIAGSLNQLARKSEERSYLGTRNKKFTLFGSSVLSRSSAKWIMTGDQIETSQVFATQAAKINPEWIEEVAMHMVKRESFDPHWSRKRQEIMAYEKVHLFGLTLIDRALVRFAPIDPDAARALFIRHGLVTGEAARDLLCVKRNTALIERMEKLEDKLRRPDVLVSEAAIVEFYEQRLPSSVCSTKTLKNWLTKQGDRHGACLEMKEEDLLLSDEASTLIEQFPDSAAIQRNELQINYLFDPSKQSDGATIDVPLALLAQLTPADIDWAVPGIVREKCTALIKGLPKATRKQLIPVNAFVDELMPLLTPGSKDLIDSLCSAISQLRKVALSRSDFTNIALLPHLNIKIRVLSAEGAELGLETSLTSLKNQFLSGQRPDAGPEAATEQEASHPLERRGLKLFPNERLPEKTEVGDGSVRLIRYPALVDDIDSVAVRLFPEREQALASHRLGVRRLAMLNSVQQRNALRKSFTRFANAHALSLIADSPDFVDDCLSACYSEALGEGAECRSEADFNEELRAAKSRLVTLGDRLAALLEQCLLTRLTLRQRLQGLSSGPEYLQRDVEGQLAGLFGGNFVRNHGFSRLREYPRYLEAITLRLSKAPFMGPRDESETQWLASCQYRLQSLHAQTERPAPQLVRALDDLRWLLEEYRVSVFAQNLKTKVSVSPKRVEKAFEAAEKLAVET